ncbi:hypothetical protein OIU84_028025 [Salix udensis]|uniref:Uncharacterized protein n=1 Tax=Salix udensis TaxID=889485 RepID=A0AAD6P8Y7_9ROSI|nr:hypothetical protein OIU84_028025 [Salix udensis]
MTASTKKHYPSSSKPPKNHHSTPNTTTTTTPQPNITQDPSPTTIPSPLSPTLKDQVLSRATHITRQELLKKKVLQAKTTLKMLQRSLLGIDGRTQDSVQRVLLEIWCQPF